MDACMYIYMYFIHILLYIIINITLPRLRLPCGTVTSAATRWSSSSGRKAWEIWGKW